MSGSHSKGQLAQQLGTKKRWRRDRRKRHGAWKDLSQKQSSSQLDEDIANSVGMHETNVVSPSWKRRAAPSETKISPRKKMPLLIAVFLIVVAFISLVYFVNQQSIFGVQRVVSYTQTETIFTTSSFSQTSSAITSVTIGTTSTCTEVGSKKDITRCKTTTEISSLYVAETYSHASTIANLAYITALSTQTQPSRVGPALIGPVIIVIIVASIVALSFLILLKRVKARPVKKIELSQWLSAIHRFLTTRSAGVRRSGGQGATVLYSESRLALVRLWSQLIALTKYVSSMRLRRENEFLKAFEDDRWNEAFEICRTHNLGSSPRILPYLKAIELNLNRPTIVFIDVESDPNTREVWEIGAIRRKGTAYLKHFHRFVSSSSKIPLKRIDDSEKSLFSAAENYERAKRDLVEFVGAAAYIGGHNIQFDIELLAEPSLSSKLLIDTLELGFLVWPTRFSHTLSALSGKDEAHRALPDALTSSDLFCSMFETLEKMESARRRVILSASKDETSRLLSDLLTVQPASCEELQTFLFSTITEQRRAFPGPGEMKPVPKYIDELIQKSNSAFEENGPCILRVNGALSVQDQIQLSLLQGRRVGLSVLCSSRDLFLMRRLASRLYSMEHPVPWVQISTSNFPRVCPHAVEAVCKTLSERTPEWRRVFLAIALWLMDHPECYPQEFSLSYWYRKSENQEWADAVMAELCYHHENCLPSCGFQIETRAQITIVDSSVMGGLKGPTIIPDAHRLEATITDGLTNEISSEKLISLTQSISVAVESKIAESLKLCEAAFDDLTRTIVEFAQNRNLRTGEDRNRVSIRLQDFFSKSVDWSRLSNAVTYTRRLLLEVATQLQDADCNPLAHLARKSAQDLTGIRLPVEPGNVSWFTVDKDVQDRHQWFFRDVKMDATPQIAKLLGRSSPTILVTDCAGKNATLRFLLGRWNLSDIKQMQVDLNNRSDQNTVSVTYLPRPSRLNLVSFLTEYAYLTRRIANTFRVVEACASNRTIMNVLRRALSETTDLPIFSRTDYESRRRAVVRATQLVHKEEPFVFLDQSFMLRSKEHNIGPSIVLLDRIPTPLSDPVVTARFESIGGGLDAYEHFVLPQTAIAINEVLSYAGSNSAPLVICDSRLAGEGMGAVLTQFLEAALTYCENPSFLEKTIRLPEMEEESSRKANPSDEWEVSYEVRVSGPPQVRIKKAKSATDSQADSQLSKIIAEALSKEGIIYDHDLSALIPLSYLKAIFGHDGFREGQEEIIRQVLRREDTFAVMPTGYGKSICYQIPAIAFSLFDEGLTLIITPLQALMRDQVLGLQRNGILRATYVNSSISPTERAQRLRGVRSGWYNLVYLSPEQLRNRGTLEAIKSREIALMVIDEAHCLSQWGHDFRPDYLYLAEFLDQLSTQPIVAAFTATATQQVIQEVRDILKIRKQPLRLSPRRKNIELRTTLIEGRTRFETEDRKKVALLEILRDLGPSKNGIIYCTFTRTTEEIAGYLKEHCKEIGCSETEIAFFHAKIPNDVKIEVQDRFMGNAPNAKTNPLRIVVATNAFGLGIDKDDIHFVIHFDIPGSVEAYYQEVGRAGRDFSISAKGILLFSEFDLDKQRLLFRNIDERDIIDVSDHLQTVPLSPDDVIYVSDTDLVRDTRLDEVGVRVAIYQLQKSGIIERGLNASNPLILRLRQDTHPLAIDSNPDAKLLWSALTGRLSDTDWRTIQLDEVARELGWQLRRAEVAFRLLSNQDTSPIIREKEFTYLFTDAQNAPRELDQVYNLQMHLVTSIGRRYHEFESGSWVTIHGADWSALLRNVRSNRLLSRVDCAKIFQLWKDLELIYYRQELSRDAVRLLVPMEDMRETLLQCLEFDRNVMMSLPRETNSFDTDDLSHLGPQYAIDESLHRLRDFGLLELSRAASKGICMSLKLIQRRPITPKDLDMAQLKRVRREREFKLELLTKYVKLGSDSERWAFIEDYFAGKFTRRTSSEILQGLNSQQAEAASASMGCLLINAGAGTGKTETVARRILYVSEEFGIPAGQILAMTFSRAGVAQLRERMRKVMPERRVDIRTYHSLANEILRTHAGEYPLWIKPGFDVEPTERLMGRALQTVDSIDDGIDPRDRAGLYSKVIQKLQSYRDPPSPAQIKDSSSVEVDRKTLQGSHIRKVYSAYLELMKRTNTIDFSFMISMTVDLLRRRPEVLRDYERRVSYLVIDEYQDTTPIQDELLSLLSAWYGNLCVVGDSDQTIFAWSNADVRNILTFEKRHEGSKRVNLEINYRSTENILNVANHCIQYNQERIPKRLISHRKVRGPRVSIQYVKDGIGTDYICNSTQQLLKSGRKASEIAVLTKTNEQLLEILTEMQKRKIPVKTPETEAQFHRNPKVQRIISAMEEAAQDRPQTSAYAVYADVVAALDSGVVSGFDEFVREFDQNSEDSSCQAFLNLVKAVTNQDARLSKEEAVIVMTIHKAKGLEYTTVFVTFLTAGSFPRYDVFIEEERRVFYVALTRAKDELRVISSENRRSRFVREIESVTDSIQHSGESPSKDDIGVQTQTVRQRYLPPKPGKEETEEEQYDELYEHSLEKSTELPTRSEVTKSLEDENTLDETASILDYDKGTCRFCGKTILFGSLREHETKCSTH